MSRHRGRPWAIKRRRSGVMGGDEAVSNGGEARLQCNEGEQMAKEERSANQ